jgi:hypothetical protein
LSCKWQTELRSLQKQNVGPFLVCLKETGVFSNEIQAVENTWKTADKRDKDADVLPIKIKIRDYCPEKR